MAQELLTHYIDQLDEVGLLTRIAEETTAGHGAQSR